MPEAGTGSDPESLQCAKAFGFAWPDASIGTSPPECQCRGCTSTDGCDSQVGLDSTPRTSDGYGGRAELLRGGGDLKFTDTVQQMNSPAGSS